MRELKELKKVEKFADQCMKCGFCAYFCPVYQEEHVETGVARGKNYLTKLVLRGEQEFTPEKVVAEETPAPDDFTQYEHFDPNQLDRLMSESLAEEDLPSNSLPRKGPGTETPEPEVVTTSTGGEI